MAINEADIVNSIDFARSESILQNTPDNPLTKLLLRISNELIDDWRKLLVNNRATGNLEQSIFPVAIAPELIEIKAPYYWKYINYGVNGIANHRNAPNHNEVYGKAPKTDKSFHEAIKKWIYDKGIKIDIPDGKTYEQELNVVAGKIVNHIRMNGIEGVHFFERVLTDARKEEMRKQVGSLVGSAIKMIIKKPK